MPYWGVHLIRHENNERKIIRQMIKTLKKLLTSNTETEVLEFKQAKTQFDKNKLGQYFSAISNILNIKNTQVGLLFS